MQYANRTKQKNAIEEKLDDQHADIPEINFDDEESGQKDCSEYGSIDNDERHDFVGRNGVRREETQKEFALNGREKRANILKSKSRPDRWLSAHHRKFYLGQF